MKTPNLPGLISGNLGVVRSARADVDTADKPVPAPKPMKPGEAQMLMFAELLQAIQSVQASSTAVLDRIGRSGGLNGVLDVRLVTIDASGMWTNDYGATIGSVAVVNHAAANSMLVASGPPGTSAPAAGLGVQKVAGGGRLLMPIGARELTVWGTAGDQFSLQVFTGLQPLGVAS